MSSPNGHGNHDHLDESPSGSGTPDSSPWGKGIAMDSPSRQLLLEVHRLSVNYDRQLHSQLDEATLERERAHKNALAAAAKEHEHVRRTAERARERLQLQIDAERRRHEEEENKVLERERQRKVEEEIAERRRQLEEGRRAEELKRQATEAKAQAEAEERRRIQRQKEDAADSVRRREQQREADRESQEAEQAARAKAEAARVEAAASSKTTQPAAALSASTAGGSRPAASEREAAHQQYIEVHRKLKEMRRFMAEQRKSNPELKTRMFDGRSLIKKSVGQLTQGTGANKDTLMRLHQTFSQALEFRYPSLDIRAYIVKELPPNLDQSQAQVSALFIYLINMFSKAVIFQFCNEAGSTPERADPTGIAAITIFAAPAFRWQGISLIDMLIAKFHVVCPVLWGIYGDEKTERGRARLGWWREDGAWISEQRHGERMTGLGAGFAALSLRDFVNNKNVNPFSHRQYWRALACIVNTPPNERTPTHCLVLKGMIELSVPRFLKFYGFAGVAALRKALIEFPNDMPTVKNSVAARALSTVPESLKTKLHLIL